MASYESGYNAILSKKFGPTDTIMYVSTAPTVTSGRIYFTDGEKKEWVSFSGVTGSTLTGCVRGLSQTADPATAGTGVTWLAGNPIKLVAMHDQLPDTKGNNTYTGTNTFTGTMNFTNVGDLNVNGKSNPYPEVADVTALTALYPSPVNGDGAFVVDQNGIMIYNENLAAWQLQGAGTTVNNASNTVAGISKIANGTQIAGGASTTPEFVLGVKDLVKISSGASDENKVPVLNASGKLADGFINTTPFLLPSSFTLGEDMTALDQAVLKTDGKIYKWKGYSDAGVEYSTGSNIGVAKSVMIDTNTIVTAYLDTSNNDVHIKAGTISAGVITYGIEADIDASAASGNIEIVKIDTNSGVVLYKKDSNSIKACPFTVSGDVVTPGTPANINGTNYDIGSTDMCCIGTNKIIIVYIGNIGGNIRPHARCATIAGNALTLGTEITDTMGAGGTGYKEAKCCKLDTDKVLFTAVNSADDIVVTAGTISGTTISSDTANIKTYTGTAVHHSVYQVSTDIAMCVFDETNIYAMYITVATTTPTIKTAQSILASTVLSGYLKPLIQLNSQVYGVQHTIDKITWFKTNISSYTTNTIKTIDYGLYLGASPYFIYSNAVPYGQDKFFMNDTSISSKKTYLMNFDSYYLLGILQTTGTATQSKAVVISGQVSTGHTSLSIGDKYYANYDGTYTTNQLEYNASNRGQVSMIGKAISATEMIINIPYEDL